MLAEGRLVNLAAGNGHPAEIMDMSFAVQALAAEWLTKQTGLEKKVYPVPEEIDDQIGRAKLAALGLAIDALTLEQEAYPQQLECVRAGRGLPSGGGSFWAIAGWPLQRRFPPADSGGGAWLSLEESRRKEHQGQAPGPRFYQPLVPTRWFFGIVVFGTVVGLLPPDILKPIWDAFSSKNMLKKNFAKESPQIRARTWDSQ